MWWKIEKRLNEEFGFEHASLAGMQWQRSDSELITFANQIDVKYIDTFGIPREIEGKVRGRKTCTAIRIHPHD